jgi:hypothetical protein
VVIIIIVLLTVAFVVGVRQATTGQSGDGSCGKEACEEVVVRGGNFATQAEGVFAGGLSDEVVGNCSLPWLSGCQ